MATSSEGALNSLQRLIPKALRRDRIVVPVVRLTGVIGFSTPLKPGLTLANLARSLERAFATRSARAIAIAINSPGGSAVQAHLIYRRVRELAAEKNLPVLAFVEDVGASGGYMIACAGDEIICDPSSIVGSIGVMGATFGFDKAMQKLGIERRVYTSGDRKVTLDPFLPEDPQDVEHLKEIQREIHEAFIALVKDRRGSKLASGNDRQLFSGEYWTGQKALSFGLVDELGDLRSILRARYGEKVETPLISERGWFGRRSPGVAAELTLAGLDRAGMVEDLLSAIETRAIWARYGL